MTELYGDFHDDEDLEENEDDIGALGSILSWDDEDEDDGDVVNRTAAAMNVALRDRENTPGTSAPPDMVQFSVKDGIPQFNFLSNNTSLHGVSGTLPLQNTDANSSITLQLPMPTPISKFEEMPQVQQQQHTSKQEHQLVQQQQSQGSALQSQIQQSGGSSNSVRKSTPNGTSTMQQLLSQQQTQQGLAATFAQLLAQQAGTLLQQQATSQPNDHTVQQQFGIQHSIQRARQSDQSSAPKSTPAEDTAKDFLQTQSEAQQAAIQNAQQQLQQLQQHARQAAQTAQQPIQQQATPAAEVSPQIMTAQQHQHRQQEQQQQATQMPHLQIPFSTDPNTFLQQLQFAQFQQQLQFAQQQQQHQLGQPLTQAPAASNEPFPQVQVQQLNPRPQPDGPPPTKRAKKSKSSAAKTSVGTKKAPAKLAIPATTPASSASSKGIVSASDTDHDGPNKKRNESSTRNSQPSEDSSFNLELLDNGNFSADDKAQANRDRNREHARNTRLRKKAYLEKLKTTVEELCRERDTLVSERAGAAGLLVEMHNTRTEVLMSFFALRSSNEMRRKLWSSILDESCFTCVMPVTPYRSFPASEVQVSKCQRTIMGIDGMMADTSSLHILFESLIDKKLFPDAKIDFRYTLVTEESVVAGNQMMARWVMSTVNATKCGALTEVSKQGMLCCKFNSAHRIIGLELMFDVMAFMLQLKQAAGSDSFSVIPNTVQTCQRSFDKPMVMTLSEPPYTIVKVNNLWEEMTGFTAEEVVGRRSCSILQGPNTDKTSMAQMMESIRFKRPSSAHIKNVRKSGEEFRHFLLVFPLSSDSRVTHYVALSNHVESCASSAVVQTAQTSSAITTPQDVSTRDDGALSMPGSLAQASPTVFQVQPQPVGSNNVIVGPASLMAPPPNVRMQGPIPPSLDPKS